MQQAQYGTMQAQNEKRHEPQRRKVSKVTFCEVCWCPILMLVLLFTFYLVMYILIPPVSEWDW
jgi:hypothetical protein